MDSMGNDSTIFYFLLTSGKEKRPWMCLDEEIKYTKNHLKTSSQIIIFRQPLTVPEIRDFPSLATFLG